MKSSVKGTGNDRRQTQSNFEMNHNPEEDHSSEITVYNLEEGTFKGTYRTVLRFRCASKNVALEHSHYISYSKYP
jgi:hypothetical protein